MGGGHRRVLLPPCPAPIPIASSDRWDWAAKAGSRCGPPPPGHPGGVGASDLPLALEGTGAVSGHCPLLLIPAGKVTCSSSSGLEQGMAQVPLAWDSPLPVFWEEWVRGQPCHRALLHHLQQPKAPGTGSAVPGVWPQSTRSPCLHPTAHVHSGVGRDTCVQMGGHIQAGETGDSCVLSPGSLLSLLGPGGPRSCQAQVQLDPQEEGVRKGAKEATSQLGALQRSLKLLCLWPHLRPARSHGGAHD